MLMLWPRMVFRTVCSSFSCMAKSPSTTACSSSPAKAAQVLMPISLPTVVPCILAVRPRVTFTMPSLTCALLPRISSMGAAVTWLGDAMSPAKLLAGVPWAARTCAMRSYTAFTPVASLRASPMPPMCMKKTLGWSKKKWLCSAVTSRPLSSAALIAGLTSSSNSTVSPIIMVDEPIGVNAAQEVSPMNGGMVQRSTLIFTSSRGLLTLKTFSARL